MSDARQRADESVAKRFSRVMNATSSGLGIATDPPLVAIATAVLLLAWLAVRERMPALATVLGYATVAPSGMALLVGFFLRGARRNVVEWLAGLPFPLENMNAVLNGLGDSFEIVFSGVRPTQEELNAALDEVNPDVFVTKLEEGEPIVEVRIGVVESKRNPARTNRARFVRVQRIVDEVFVPLSRRCPIESVRVK